VDFARSEEQDEIAGLAARILTDMVTVDRLRAVEDDDGHGGGASGDRFDREVWSALADTGLLGVALPADLGGSGLGIVEQCLVLEQVGRTVAPVPVLASCVLGALPIATFGTDDQRTRWVPPMISGQVVLTAALVEPANRQPERPTTVATRDGDGWRLTGLKTCVPAGTVADAIVISATIDGGGAGLFVVEPGADGLTIEGQRVTNRDLEAQVTLDGVPAELVTDDAAALGWLLERATVGLCAQAAGVVGRALELTAAYAKERVQFGRPIATFQAVGQRAADAYIDVEATRLVLWQAAWRLSEGLPSATEVQVAKYWAAEAAHRVGHTAVHIHGGTGVDVDHPIHRYLIASRELELTLGGATDQLLRIGASLAASRS